MWSGWAALRRFPRLNCVIFAGSWRLLRTFWIRCGPPDGRRLLDEGCGKNSAWCPLEGGRHARLTLAVRIAITQYRWME